MNTISLTPQLHDPVLHIQARGATLEGSIVVPDLAQQLLVFVQADGSCRLNPRNYYLAYILQQHGFATLLLDLMTLEEQVVSSRAECLRYDVATLAMRLVTVTDWLLGNPHTQHLKVSYLGLNRGVQVAVMAATERPNIVASIILPSRNFQPLEHILLHVKAPTLLIIGREDESEMAQYGKILSLLAPGSDLLTLPHLDLLFHGSNKLEYIARQIGYWLKQIHTETVER